MERVLAAARAAAITRTSTTRVERPAPLPPGLPDDATGD